jgi:hypothetical protein
MSRNLVLAAAMVVALLLAGFALYRTGFGAGVRSVEPRTEIVVKRDSTTVIETRVDTHYVQTPPVSTGRLPAPRPVSQDTTSERKIRVYTLPYRDTLLTADVTAEVDGTLLAWTFDYTAQIPIVTRDSFVTTVVRVDSTVVLRPPSPPRITLGVMAGVVYVPEVPVRPTVGPQVLLRVGPGHLGYSYQRGIGDASEFHVVSYSIPLASF